MAHFGEFQCHGAAITLCPDAQVRVPVSTGRVPNGADFLSSIVNMQSFRLLERREKDTECMTSLVNLNFLSEIERTPWQMQRLQEQSHEHRWAAGGIILELMEGLFRAVNKRPLLVQYKD